MKKTIIIMMVLLVCASFVSALGNEPRFEVGMDSHDLEEKADARELSWWEKWFGSLFSIGTFIGPNCVSGTGDQGSDCTFDVDFLVGETITVKFDAETYNLKCLNAKFVIEQYGPNGDPAKDYFIQSYSSDRLSAQVNGGSRSYHGMISLPAESPGDYALVTYIWCYDWERDFTFNNPEKDIASDPDWRMISQWYKIQYSVQQQLTECTEPDRYTSNPYCAEGKVVRNYRENCENKLVIVETCSYNEVCDVDKCVPKDSTPDPTDDCSSDDDCKDSQFCDDGVCREKSPEPECKTDSDCDGGFVCVEETCREVDPDTTCENDDDCKEGYECLKEQCVKKETEPKTVLNMKALVIIGMIILAILVLAGAGGIMFFKRK